MKKLFLLLIIASLFITGCFDFGSEREGCNGAIIVENSISDTTLTVGDEFRRDVFKEPVVLRHTAGQGINILVTSEDGGIIADANGRRNNETGNVTVVEVIAKSEGETTVSITATDGCDGYQVITTFNVNVIDTQNNS